MNYKVGDYIIDDFAIYQISLIEDFEHRYDIYNGEAYKIALYNNDSITLITSINLYYFQFQNVKPITDRLLKQLVFQ